MFQDYLRFLEWGRAWLYGDYIGVYPLPMTAFFAFLSLLPWWLGYALLVATSILILVRHLKWTAPLWFAYVPVLQVLLVGNIDIIWLGLYLIRTPLSLMLMTLKPQLFLFALPEVWRLRGRWKEFLFWGALLYLPAFLVRPNWVAEWIQLLRAQSRPAIGWSASIWGMPLYMIVAAILLGLAVLVKIKRADWRPTLLFLDPAIAGYDYALLVGYTPLLIPLSWVCQYLEITHHVFWPWALLGILAVPLSTPAIKETLSKVWTSCRGLKPGTA